MGTSGNLELRVSTNIVQYCGTTHEGYRAYEIVPMLADFLDTKPEETVPVMEWFSRASKEVFPNSQTGQTVDGVRCEVVVDFERKLILHNADNESFEMISLNRGRDFTKVFEDAVKKLRERHRYQILRYENPAQLRPTPEMDNLTLAQAYFGIVANGLHPYGFKKIRTLIARLDTNLARFYHQNGKSLKNLKVKGLGERTKKLLELIIEYGEEGARAKLEEDRRQTRRSRYYRGDEPGGSWENAVRAYEKE